jgi:hypothetical protein
MKKAIRTTVDVPAVLHRKLKAQAEAQGMSVQELIVLGLHSVLLHEKRFRGRRVKFPLIVSEGLMVELTYDQIYEHVEFP